MNAAAYRPPYPVPGVIWASLPLPSLLVDGEGRIVEANPAAETFLNASARSLFGQPVLDRLAIDAPWKRRWPAPAPTRRRST